MKKLNLTIISLLFLSSAVFAQNRSRVFDNFDTSRGVQVVSSTVAPITERKTKTGVKKTSMITPKITLKNNTKTNTRNNVVRVEESYALKDKRSAEYTKMLMAAGSSMKGFTTGSLEYDSYIVDSSRRYNIDPLLIYAQMHQESSFKLKATSYKGASGLMQLMPATARRFGVTEIYNPKQNIEAGVRYMRWLLNTFNGDVSLALAGYNAGEGAVMKYGWQIPPYRETQEYVRRISARYSAISNPMLAKSVKKVSSTQIAKLETKAAKPLTTYEPNAVAVRTPDGRMRLVNQ